MAWIKSFQELGDHPKTKRGARLLGISRPQMVGHLHYLWWWASSYAEDGSLAGYTPEDIADAAMWEGDPWEIINALLECGINGKPGFLERDEAGNFLIHDWDEYAGKLAERRATERERQRNKRASAALPSKDVAATLEQQPANVGATLHPSRARESREEEEESREEESTVTVAPAVPSVAAQVREVWEYFKTTIQPKARECPTEKIKACIKGGYAVDDLKAALDRFKNNYWWYTNNRTQRSEWFFKSKSQIEGFLLLEPETQEEYEARHGRRISPNGQHGDSAARPSDAPPVNKLRPHDAKPDYSRPMAEARDG